MCPLTAEDKHVYQKSRRMRNWAVMLPGRGRKGSRGSLAPHRETWAHLPPGWLRAQNSGAPECKMSTIQQGKGGDGLVCTLNTQPHRTHPDPKAETVSTQQGSPSSALRSAAGTLSQMAPRASISSLF